MTHTPGPWKAINGYIGTDERDVPEYWQITYPDGFEATYDTLEEAERCWARITGDAV